MKKLVDLATGTPTYDRWQEATRVLDGLAPDAQEDAARAFEAATAHWPTALNPWTGFDLAPGLELRRSPEHWVKEIYAGQHAPKHSLVRILESPRRPMGAQKLELLLTADARIENVRQVGYNQLKVSSGFLKALKGEGPWRKWKALRLWTCDLKASALKLLGAADLSNLEMLNLEQNHLGEEGIKGLVKAPGFSALTSVHLGLNDLDAAAADALGRMDWARRLTWLNLHINKLHDEGLDRLVGDGLTALRTLDLSENHVGHRTADWSRGLPGLESLRLNKTAVTDAGIEAMLPNLPALHSLNLDATGVGDRGALAIAAGGQRWKALSLQSTAITPAGLGAILRSPGAASMEQLNLGSGFDLDNAMLLVGGACPTLRRLWWNGPEIGKGVEKALRADPRIAATLAY